MNAWLGHFHPWERLYSTVEGAGCCGSITSNMEDVLYCRGISLVLWGYHHRIIGFSVLLEDIDGIPTDHSKDSISRQQ